MGSDDKVPVWRTLPKFLLVGVANTALGAAIMFLLYNLACTGYWLSTAISYLVGSVFSFFANRSFTLRHKGAVWASGNRPYYVSDVLLLAMLLRSRLPESTTDRAGFTLRTWPTRVTLVVVILFAVFMWFLFHTVYASNLYWWY